jgi:sigma-B regulation protein RsbU (phosphoserine phosphatase)
VFEVFVQQTVMTSDPPRETHTPRPVLVVDDIAFERTEHIMKPGDRLFIVSDGVTECPDPSGALLDQEGFERMLGPLVNAHAQDVINDILSGLEA